VPARAEVLAEGGISLAFCAYPKRASACAVCHPHTLHDALQLENAAADRVLIIKT